VALATVLPRFEIEALDPEPAIDAGLTIHAVGPLRGRVEPLAGPPRPRR
jgi:hypothetical protein